VKELLWQTRTESAPPELEPFPSHEPKPALPEPSETLDLRAFVDALDRAGRLLHVKETVDWKLGIGRWSRARHKPLLFERIKGYPRQRLFTNGLADPACLRMALGISGAIRWAELIEEARYRIKTPVQTKIVRTGPVLENVIPASMLDLLQFPVPQWSASDAGRYLGTWHLNISKDPETGQRNAGVYRMQLLGAKRATISAAPNSDLARHVAHAEEKGIELPVAVVIGAPEVMAIAAAAACPEGMDEFELAGALQEKAVELIECGNLEVPAHSEIIVEGFIHPDIRVQDGPYVDYTGTATTNPKAFLFEATRLMHRDNPIFRGTAAGKPGGEDHQLFAFLAQLRMLNFHGSRLKRKVQNHFWGRRSFHAAQMIGKMGSAPR